MSKKMFTLEADALQFSEIRLSAKPLAYSLDSSNPNDLWFTLEHDLSIPISSLGQKLNNENKKKNLSNAPVKAKPQSHSKRVNASKSHQKPNQTLHGRKLRNQKRLKGHQKKQLADQRVDKSARKELDQGHKRPLKSNSTKSLASNSSISNSSLGKQKSQSNLFDKYKQKPLPKSILKSTSLLKSGKDSFNPMQPTSSRPLSNRLKVAFNKSGKDRSLPKNENAINQIAKEQKKLNPKI